MSLWRFSPNRNQEYTTKGLLQSYHSWLLCLPELRSPNEYTLKMGYTSITLYYYIYLRPFFKPLFRFS